MQGLLSATTSVAIFRALSFVRWGLVRRPEGLSYISLLALAPSSGYLGLLRILGMPGFKLTSRLFSMLNLTLMAMAWLAGLLLFLKTSLVTVYDTIDTYQVTAGVGMFRPEYVAPYFAFLSDLEPGYPYKLLPYSSYAVVYNLVANPIYSTVEQPIDCTGSGCASYLMSGGILMTTPWQPEGYPEHQSFRTHQTPTVQMEFQTGPGNDTYAEEYCEIYGADSGTLIAMRFCMAADPNKAGRVKAAFFVCTAGALNGTCDTSPHHSYHPNITTTMSFYTRKATIVSARSNFTISAVTDLTTPSFIPMTAGPDLEAYRSVISWLLNYTAAGIPAPSAIIESFFSGQNELASPASYGILSQNFQSILAFPLWFFNPNNFGNPDLLRNSVMTVTLPAEHYVDASVVAPVVKIKFDQPLFVAFICLQGVVLAFVLAVAIWAGTNAREMPAISSFPLFDVAFKTNVDVIDGQPDRRFVWDGRDREVTALMREATVWGKLD
ncbi:hypothetical protein B0H66DRAFT_347508 [Apodospora peruviana]|uniref:Uncharacterized protein n=1 Tax=Apodospora peruviana TaxID=516989 RepID=A0AAE0M2J4_9PEZI|nr:hypothetical protein B0H66DRAFT_347508 [Apodospora peruviana]